MEKAPSIIVSFTPQLRGVREDVNKTLKERRSLEADIKEYGQPAPKRKFSHESSETSWREVFFRGEQKCDCTLPTPDPSAVTLLRSPKKKNPLDCRLALGELNFGAQLIKARLN